MPNSSKVIFNEIDNTRTVATAAVGINALQMVTKRGPIGKAAAQLVISSWAQFEKIYGGLIPGSDGPLIAQRALNKGSQLRVNRVLHYATISDSTSFDATYAAPVATSIITYSGAIVAGQTVQVVSNSITTSQVFVTDSITTLRQLAIKLKTSLAGFISDAYALSGTVLVLVPKTTALTPTSTVTGGTPPTATVTSQSSFKVATTDAFSLTPKWPGKDYNDIIQSVENASNGNANYFDLVFTHTTDPSASERWPNLRIVGNPTALTSNYLESVVRGSQLFNVTYNNLSALTGQLRPGNIKLKLGTGTDGTVPTDTDYIGDSAGKTGFYAFDGVDDITLLGVADKENAAVHIAGAAYADARKDLVYVGHLSNNLTTENALAAERDSYAIDTTYAAFTAGGLIIVDSFTNQNRGISELGDYFGVSAVSDNKYGPWYSVANDTRGAITDVMGIVNNFGYQGNVTGLDLLANRQIMLAVNKNKKNKFIGNYTATLDNSQLSYLSIRKLLIYIKKSLGPTLEQFLEDPNDFTTWLSMYQTAKPFLDGLQTKRALVNPNGYEWQGDQFATSMENLVINDPDDVDDGKYKVRLLIKAINAIREIAMDVTLTRSSVSFEDSIV